MTDTDRAFFDRADAHIALSNEQTKDVSDRTYVSASNMYATARFNAWLVACNWNNGEEMKKGKQHTMDFFVNQYKEMLEQNFDDYVANFDTYINNKRT
jgi:hypothetical protein